MANSVLLFSDYNTNTEKTTFAKFWHDSGGGLGENNLVGLCVEEHDDDIEDEEFMLKNYRSIVLDYQNIIELRNFLNSVIECSNGHK